MEGIAMGVITTVSVLLAFGISVIAGENTLFSSVTPIYNNVVVRQPNA